MANETAPEIRSATVLGQKYAYATAALVMGIASYISLLGLEKAILAILFAYLALRTPPEPRLHERRGWATAGLVLGIIMIALIPALLFLYADRFRELAEAMKRLT